VISVDVVYFQV